MDFGLKIDREICEACETVDCLMKCQYMQFSSVDEAKQERMKILDGEVSRVLDECATCYACEEYCPVDNHPFYRIVEAQERLGRDPVPVPLTRQQIKMMAPRGKIAPEKVTAPVMNMCFFPMLVPTIGGRLYEGVSTIAGSDIFCNIMWLHFARNSVIRERLPRMIENIMEYYLKDSGVSEVICYHDECYGAYTHLAPAFDIEVPFKCIHLFEYLAKRLAHLKDEIKPLNTRVVYQRPCSNRLVPETAHWVDEIFERIGVERPEREYERENALCCSMVIRAAQRDRLADDVQKRNIEDMAAVGAEYCVFNCPMCFFTLHEMVAERGIKPILMSDLCKIALGEGMGW